MKYITQLQAKQLGKYYNIDFDVVPFKEWHLGLNIELEHGSKLGRLTNVTKNTLKLTAKIALAHLIEDPRYYYYLKKLESKRALYWSKKQKPNIFLT
jgi:hypothetical protein